MGAPGRCGRVNNRMTTHRLWLVLGFLVGGIMLPAAQPSSSDPAAQKASDPELATPGKAAKVDLNTADIPTLEAIPEIGTNFANAVFSSRPFKTVEDVNRILRLTPEKLQDFSRRVVVQPVKPSAPTPPDGIPTGASKASAKKEGKATPAKEVTERYDAAKAKASPPQDK